RGVYAIKSWGDRAIPAAATVRTMIESYLARRGLTGTYRMKHFAERGFEPGAAIAKPRVLLVGEAAGIDIATGEGIAQAIQYGRVAARYLGGAFRSQDFSFGDWHRYVYWSGLGQGMLRRLLMYKGFYPEREKAER